MGMINLFFMGRILVLNLVDHGFVSAGYCKDITLPKKSSGHKIHSAADIIYCIKLFRKPNSIMMLVPAGAPAGAVINNLAEHFKLDDFSLAEVQLCLSRFNTSKKSQKSKLKFLLERK